MKYFIVILIFSFCIANDLHGQIKMQKRFSVSGIIGKGTGLYHVLTLDKDGSFILNNKVYADGFPREHPTFYKGNYVVNKKIVGLIVKTVSTNYNYTIEPDTTLPPELQTRLNPPREPQIGIFPCENLPISKQFRYIKKGKTLYLIDPDFYKEKSKFKNKKSWLEFNQHRAYKLSK